MNDVDMILWNKLRKHRGHKVSIASYGYWDNPADICLECKIAMKLYLMFELKETTDNELLLDTAETWYNSSIQHLANDIYKEAAVRWYEANYQI